ncbi:MAG: serine/threonine protein kinase [Microbacteriaceae bacterium]|nr:serine/threonine protein kinase [Microbacteriaceae bacterium]
MARRLPSPPPVLAGFVHQRVLGSGGFADVYLYEQNLPRRQVAVKALLSEIVDEHLRGMFRAEVNVMAQLSAHPSILTVYQAGVAADGRPFMVMELCSGALGDRYRRERIPVAEVLGIAVNIGSALETAHRAGVLHRDLKPSNILITAYGHPVLSDFGIASTLGDAQLAVGLSVPWSAPETLIDELPVTVRSEVFSFAATIYSLLAGRSPCEISGATTTAGELTARIDRGQIQGIERPDVPASLERSLRRALSRTPAERPATVLQLVREFQACQSELGLTQTPIEVEFTDWAFPAASTMEEKTLLRGIGSEVPTSPSAMRARRRRSDGARLDSTRLTGTSADGSFVLGDRGALNSGAVRRRRRFVPLFAFGAVILSAAITGVAVELTRSQQTEIPVVRELRAVGSVGAVRFSWTDPGVRETDRYLIHSPGSLSSVQTGRGFTIDARAGERVCATVTVTRDSRSGRPSASVCATVNL